MNFQLTKEQELVRKMVRGFADAEVEPIAAAIDQEQRFPRETVEKMARYGLLGVPFPREYGGAENRIGIIRRYFPKKTNWALISQRQLDRIINKINHRPMKCLGFKSPYQVFLALRD